MSKDAHKFNPDNAAAKIVEILLQFEKTQYKTSLPSWSDYGVSSNFGQVHHS